MKTFDFFAITIPWWGVLLAAFSAVLLFIHVFIGQLSSKMKIVLAFCLTVSLMACSSDVKWLIAGVLSWMGLVLSPFILLLLLDRLFYAIFWLKDRKRRAKRKEYLKNTERTIYDGTIFGD